MKITKEKFSDIFADQLNRLDLAFDVLASGLENAYDGKCEFELEHSNSPGLRASLSVQAECVWTWGFECPEWWASGHIIWNTSSKHYVRFEFSREQQDEIELNQIIITDDDSEYFYPSIVDACTTNHIPLVVVVKMVYEVYFETDGSNRANSAVQRAFDEYLRRECHAQPTGDWRDDLALDDDFIGLGADGHEDADGPVFSNETAARSLAAYLDDVAHKADIIKHS